MRQASLIACYGDKPPELAERLRACQRRLARALGPVFRPLAEAQIHATIVGLERAGGGDAHNRNYARLRGERRAMDLPGFLRSLADCRELPLCVRCGGFAAEERPFTSRGLSPYLRSFSIQGDKVVLIGWPEAHGAFASGTSEPVTYARSLAQLRRSAEGFGILHAYHGEAQDDDNDCYFRIGRILRRALGETECEALENRMRDWLARERALRVSIAAADLQLASYDDETLPPSTTRVFGLLEALEQPALLESLYR